MQSIIKLQLLLKKGWHFLQKAEFACLIISMLLVLCTERYSDTSGGRLVNVTLLIGSLVLSEFAARHVCQWNRSVRPHSKIKSVQNTSGWLKCFSALQSNDHHLHSNSEAFWCCTWAREKSPCAISYFDEVITCETLVTCSLLQVHSNSPNPACQRTTVGRPTVFPLIGEQTTVKRQRTLACWFRWRRSPKCSSPDEPSAATSFNANCWKMCFRWFNEPTEARGCLLHI